MKRTSKIVIIVLIVVFFFISLTSFLVYGLYRLGKSIDFSQFMDISLEEEDSTPQLLVTKDEERIINVIKESKPSVVSIAVSDISLESRGNIGTGFIVDQSGLIITNQHVVSNTQVSYKIITDSGVEYDVIDVVRDDLNDIAVLKVDGSNLPVLELGDSDNLVVGQTVIAIGTPLGEYSGSVTTGIISGLNRSVSTSSSWFDDTSKSYENVIQTDTAINPGNSGGPLIGTDGRVVGVNFATTSNADNISFALPINVVKSRLEEYRTYGKFIKPYIGISYQMVSEFEALFYGDSVVEGALVLAIDPYGPSSSSGLQRGDIITKINGNDLEGTLSTVIQGYGVGEEISISYWRAGETKETKVVLKEAD